MKPFKVNPMSMGPQGETDSSPHGLLAHGNRDSSAGRSTRPPVSPRSHKPTKFPKPKTTGASQRIGKTEPADSDDNDGNYEVVTPDLTAKVPADMLPTRRKREPIDSDGSDDYDNSLEGLTPEVLKDPLPTQGEDIEGTRSKRESDYEIVDLPTRVPDGPPHTPHRSKAVGNNKIATTDSDDNEGVYEDMTIGLTPKPRTPVLLTQREEPRGEPPNRVQGKPLPIPQGPLPIPQGPPPIHHGPPPIHRGPPPIHNGPPPIDHGPPPTDHVPPPIPQRDKIAEKDFVHLPLPPDKGKNKGFKTKFSDTLDKARKGVKTIVGAIQRAPKDKPGTETAVTYPVELYPPTPFRQVQEEDEEESPEVPYPPTDDGEFPIQFIKVPDDSCDSSDTDDDYEALDTAEMGGYLLPSKNLWPPETGGQWKSQGPRTMPTTPPLLTEAMAKTTHTASSSRTPTAYVKPMQPTRKLSGENETPGIQQDKAIPQVVVIHPVKPTPVYKDTQLTKGQPPRTPSPGVALPGLTRKDAAPQTAPKPASSRKPRQVQSKIEFTKMNSISVDDVKDFSVEKLCQCLKRLGLEEKVNIFFEKKVDGELFLKLKEGTFRNEFNLTDTEVLNIERFRNEGKFPKTSNI